MSDETSKLESDRQLLAGAQAKGGAAVWKTYVKLSGPGWLQSAITLGGGSLAGALFLGILGGTSMLWLQLMAIVMGVIMLSAISYVTLSTGERPFQAINKHINPVLGWGWLIATAMANIIWCMPQFSLCFDAIDKNLVPGGVGDSLSAKLGISAVILVAVSIAVTMNSRRGLAAKVFDWFLKGLVGLIVICFFGVAIRLSSSGVLDWGQILLGFIPDFSQWTQPTGKVAVLIDGLSEQIYKDYWTQQVVEKQQAIMIGAAATAVGINMTFLLPYSMMHRGWDKTFRGLARFDLATGMAIPYVLVTSCVVIAAAQMFHAVPPDPQFMSEDPVVFKSSPTFNGAKDLIYQCLNPKEDAQSFDEAVEGLDAEQEMYLVGQMAKVPRDEKLIASSLVKRDAFALSKALAPLLGENTAKYVFGIGVFGMGFSTIIILMLINGFVFCEAAGKPHGGGLFVSGCLVAGVAGAIWPLVWGKTAGFWLAILASSFGAMLLPIAYITFFMMMNSKTLMGDEKPKGLAMVVWNVLMGFSVAGAVGAAWIAVRAKASDPTAGPVVVIVGVVFVILAILGFFFKPVYVEDTKKES